MICSAKQLTSKSAWVSAAKHSSERSIPPVFQRGSGAPCRLLAVCQHNPRIRTGIESKNLSPHKQRSHSNIRCLSSHQPTATDGSHGFHGALFFEVEGAVVDMHMDGHRAAFNQAFKDLGYDCLHWPAHIYNDLLTVGDGSPETLINNFFSTIGWPTMLATSDRQSFVKKVHATKQDALSKMLREAQVPLRDGVKKVIEDALRSGAQVVFLTGTLSEAGDMVASNALKQLDPLLAARIKVYSSGVVAQDTLGSATAEQEEKSLQQVLRERQTQAKQEAARMFVANLRVKDEGLAVNVDPTLLQAGSRSMSPEWLAAVAATLGVPLARCALIASNNSVINAGVSARMLGVAVPRRMAERGAFENATAKFSGFGIGECTWMRLSHLLSAREAR